MCGFTSSAPFQEKATGSGRHCTKMSDSTSVALQAFENRRHRRARCFAFCCLGLSIWFLVSGICIILLGRWISDGDEYWKPYSRTTIIVGPIVLILGLIMIVTAIVTLIRASRRRVFQASSVTRTTEMVQRQQALMSPPCYEDAQILSPGAFPARASTLVTEREDTGGLPPSYEDVLEKDRQDLDDITAFLQSQASSL